MAVDPVVLARILVCAFFAVLFLQSGLDKVFDFKGNLAYLSGHFEKSPLRSMVPMLLGVITLFEVATGVFCALGAVASLAGELEILAVAGLGLACATLIMLFTGQRLAKDYAGAAVLASYFAVALIGLWLMPRHG